MTLREEEDWCVQSINSKVCPSKKNVETLVYTHLWPLKSALLLDTQVSAHWRSSCLQLQRICDNDGISSKEINYDFRYILTFIVFWQPCQKYAWEVRTQVVKLGEIISPLWKSEQPSRAGTCQLPDSLSTNNTCTLREPQSHPRRVGMKAPCENTFSHICGTTFHI